MCGRYTITRGLERFAEYAGYRAAGPEFTPRFNVAPGQSAPVARLAGAERTIASLRWGLVPFWAADEKIAYKTINARAETLAERASFKHALHSRRCLVLADGFYEWQALPGGGKQPYFIYLASGEPFALAGLWESWTRSGGAAGAPGTPGQPLETFTIVTTEPNELMARIHHRMPVILTPEAAARWLDPAAARAELLALCAPYPAALMAAHPVDAKVGSPRHDGPELVLPLEPA